MFKIISLEMKVARTARKLSFKGSRPFRIYRLRTRLRLVRVHVNVGVPRCEDPHSLPSTAEDKKGLTVMATADAPTANVHGMNGQTYEGANRCNRLLALPTRIMTAL
jgi:hypothetical protein